MKQHHGFTLTEILIALAVLGILAALILPRYTGATEQGRVSEAIAILNAAWQGEETWRNDNGDYITVSSNPDVPVPNTGWTNIGMSNPNNNPNRFFDYFVMVPAVNQFLARAGRNNFSANVGQFEDKTICINQSGIWSGDHPLRPQNAPGVTCDNSVPPLAPCC